MKRNSFCLLLASTAVCCIAAISNSTNSSREQDDRSDSQVSVALDPEEQLLEIAKVYREWGPVDALARFAPILCRRPLPSDLHAIEARLSQSGDSDTHGQKLYLMYAKDKENYRGAGDVIPNVGQVIVKQSWVPKQITYEEVLRGISNEELTRLEELGFPRRHTVEIDDNDLEIVVTAHAQKGDEFYLPDQPGPLFVMYRTDDETDETDNGWIYGVVSADGTEVLGVGKMQQCMDCHVDAGEGRLFGLPDPYF